MADASPLSVLGVVANQHAMDGLARSRMPSPQPVFVRDAYLNMDLQGRLRFDATSQGARWLGHLQIAQRYNAAAEQWIAFTAPRNIAKKPYAGCVQLDEAKLQATAAAGATRMFLDSLRAEPLEAKLARVEALGTVAKKLGVKVHAGFDLSLKAGRQAFQDALDSDGLDAMQVYIRNPGQARHMVAKLMSLEAEHAPPYIVATDARPRLDAEGASTYAYLAGHGIPVVVPSVVRPIMPPEGVTPRPHELRARDRIHVYCEPLGAFRFPHQLPEDWQCTEAGPASTFTSVHNEGSYNEARFAASRGSLYGHWRALQKLQTAGKASFFAERPALAPYIGG